MSEQLTPQQQLLLDQQWRMLDDRSQAGDHLDNKAAAILQAGSLIIALVGAVSIPPVLAQQSPPILLGGLAFALAVFAGMLVCALLAWQPRDYRVPGSTSWNSMWNNYVNAGLQDAFAQILSNIQAATETHERRNALKARYVTWGTWLLVLQVAGILLIALAGAL